MSEYIQSVMAILPDQTLPDPDTISHYVLENERKIYLDFDVGDSLMAIHRMIIRWNMSDKGMSKEDRRPIWIYIMSYGGDIDYLWMLVDAIKTSQTPIYTVNIGKAASAAALIFVAGEKRYMFKNSTVIIHEGAASIEGDAIKVLDQSESYKKELKKMKDFILENTSIPRQQLMKKRNNDWVLDSMFCLENGVCDKIVENIEDII